MARVHPLDVPSTCHGSCWSHIIWFPYPLMTSNCDPISLKSIVAREEEATQGGKESCLWVYYICEGSFTHHSVHSCHGAYVNQPNVYLWHRHSVLHITLNVAKHMFTVVESELSSTLKANEISSFWESKFSLSELWYSEVHTLCWSLRNYWTRILLFCGKPTQLTHLKLSSCLL